MRSRATVLAAGALWMFIGVGIAVGDPSHQYPDWKNAVDEGSRELRYVSDTEYGNALLHAKQVWNAIRTPGLPNPTVRLRQPGETATLIVLDHNLRNVDTLGEWFYKSGKPSRIKLNCWWLGPPGICEEPGHNLKPANENIVLAHEIGHTLGLDHMAYDQLLDATPIHSDNVKVSTPQAHDKFHYHARWDR